MAALALWGGMASALGLASAQAQMRADTCEGVAVASHAPQPQDGTGALQAGQQLPYLSAGRGDDASNPTYYEGPSGLLYPARDVRLINCLVVRHAITATYDPGYSLQTNPDAPSKSQPPTMARPTRTMGRISGQWGLAQDFARRVPIPMLQFTGDDLSGNNAIMIEPVPRERQGLEDTARVIASRQWFDCTKGPLALWFANGQTFWLPTAGRCRGDQVVTELNPLDERRFGAAVQQSWLAALVQGGQALELQADPGSQKAITDFRKANDPSQNTRFFADMPGWALTDYEFTYLPPTQGKATAIPPAGRPMGTYQPAPYTQMRWHNADR
ncbi:hypothetical protein E3E12_06605 [Formicincola oecophyllae]|uniref:Uncharacterized protein n=1 Tax=Formicincola oecophyllae TaxID=2558361 RepID=A0A4Y6UBG0_9PROT|nr:hypothetical protein [Formicincola oecophyllae]QDH13908.2 hypothetical protein E3E12_06605 [Formicincola oecophyllae]